MLRVALTELRKTPKLQDCDPYSFVGSILVCAQLGLEPGSSLGHVYLIPYGKTVQVQLGYRGMIDLARRSGQIISLSAQAVYSNDEFKYELGLNESLSHKPNIADRGELIAVYAIAQLVGGGHQIDVMSKSDVEKVRRKSAQANSPAWRDYYDEMARKTVVKRLFKYLPVSIEIRDALSVDDASSNGQFDAKYALEGTLEDGIMFDTETGEVTSEIEETSQADELASKVK